MHIHIQLKYKPQYIPCSVLMTKNANLFCQIMQLIVLCIYGYLFCVSFFEYGGFVFVFAFEERNYLPMQVEKLCKCLAYSRLRYIWRCITNMKVMLQYK